MAEDSQAKILESNTLFSESHLWQLQREFFDKQGVQAWHQQVPLYITSNPFIARCYAEVVLHFIYDQVSKDDRQQTYYVMELGTGSGKFSFYCMKTLFQLQEELDMTDVDIVYVMSDFTNSNVDFWQTQPQLAPYVEAKKLDFCVFDLGSDQQVELINRKQVLDSKTVKTPLIVFANYIFDTIPHDVFRIENRRLQVGKTLLTTNKPNASKGDFSQVNLEDVETTFHYKDVHGAFYNDKTMDDVLHEYKRSLKDTSFLFPTASFRCLQQLMKMSGNRLLVLSTDKGYSYLTEIQGRGDPKVVTHGSFSMMVNFHALGEFFKNCGGEYWHQRIRESIKTSVFLVGDKFSELPFTRYAVRSYVDDFGPGDFFNYHRRFRETKDTCEMKTIVSHLNFSRWDPRIFNLFIDRIIAEIPKAQHILIDALQEGLQTVIENIYDMPGVEESYYNVAIFLHGISQFSDALTYYKKSLEHQERNPRILYSIALCYYAMNDQRNALKYFQEVVDIDDKITDAAEWIKRIKSKLR